MISRAYKIAVCFNIVLISGGMSALMAEAENSLSGHVYDEITNLPIEGAIVRVLGSSVAARTEAPNGLFTLVDIPANAIANGAVELLITKDGYRPETLVHASGPKRASIALAREESLVKKWLRTLKEKEGSCQTRQTIVETIEGFGIDHPPLRLEAEDALLEIYTSADFSYSQAESFVANDCLRKLREGKRCDDASELFDKETKENLEKAAAAAKDDPVKQRDATRMSAVMLALRCMRPDKQTEKMFSEAMELFLNGKPMVARVVPEDSLGAKSGLKVGDLIIAYNNHNISSVEEWSEYIVETKEKKDILMEIRRGKVGSFIRVPGGDLGIVVGPAKPEELPPENLPQDKHSESVSPAKERLSI